MSMDQKFFQHISSTCKTFFTADESFSIPIIKIQSFGLTAFFSNGNLGEPLHISIAHCDN